jgi:hypothetical protein
MRPARITFMIGWAILSLPVPRESSFYFPIWVLIHPPSISYRSEPLKGCCLFPIEDSWTNREHSPGSGAASEIASQVDTIKRFIPLRVRLRKMFLAFSCALRICFAGLAFTVVFNTSVVSLYFMVFYLIGCLMGHMRGSKSPHTQ